MNLVCPNTGSCGAYSIYAEGGRTSNFDVIRESNGKQYCQALDVMKERKDDRTFDTDKMGLSCSHLQLLNLLTQIKWTYQQ